MIDQDAVPSGSPEDRGGEEAERTSAEPAAALDAIESLPLEERAARYAAEYERLRAALERSS
jgi:hypothetical protein